jgi:Fe-Mn family superoxide dismutase
MTQEIKKFEHLLGTAGFSEMMLKNHFALYEGYVKNVNIFLDLSKTLKVGSPEYNELRRRFSWEWNGVRLHELYFANLTKEAAVLSTESELYKKISTAFGSYENWLADFKALGLTRGIGWAVLVKDKVTGALMNIWIGEHNTGLLAGTEILLIMDVWEHAYLTDYGIKRADYIDKFIEVINWPVVESRLFA